MFCFVPAVALRFIALPSDTDNQLVVVPCFVVAAMLPVLLFLLIRIISWFECLALSIAAMLSLIAMSYRGCLATFAISM